LRTDSPRLDVRLPGLEARSPQRVVLTRGEPPAGWTAIPDPRAIAGRGWQYLFVEGGADTATAFLNAGLVDRLLLYRSPARFGQGIAAFPDGLPEGWDLADRRPLGSDTLDVYEPA
jgi:diaminohydroxyphosphoribosylaminopyrimidine deaminase/5-amino-6-(5-phosphoribosylamino)uracil reductase